MTSLAIDATHTYASLTKPFFSFSLDNVIMAILMVTVCVWIIGFFIYVPHKGVDFIIGVGFGLAMSIVYGTVVYNSYANYNSEPHVSSQEMKVSTVSYRLKTNSNGDIKSVTNPDDKSGTTNLEIITDSGHSEIVKISKKTTKMIYNSGAKPKLVLTKLTDLKTDKSYYISKSVTLNNQPIQFK